MGSLRSSLKEYAWPKHGARKPFSLYIIKKKISGSNTKKRIMSNGSKFLFRRFSPNAYGKESKKETGRIRLIKP